MVYLPTFTRRVVKLDLLPSTIGFDYIKLTRQWKTTIFNTHDGSMGMVYLPT